MLPALLSAQLTDAEALLVLARSNELQSLDEPMRRQLLGACERRRLPRYASRWPAPEPEPVPGPNCDPDPSPSPSPDHLPQPPPTLTPTPTPTPTLFLTRYATLWREGAPGCSCWLVLSGRLQLLEPAGSTRPTPMPCPSHAPALPLPCPCHAHALPCHAMPCPCHTPALRLSCASPRISSHLICGPPCRRQAPRAPAPPLEQTALRPRAGPASGQWRAARL